MGFPKTFAISSSFFVSMFGFVSGSPIQFVNKQKMMDMKMLMLNDEDIRIEMILIRPLIWSKTKRNILLTNN